MKHPSNIIITGASSGIGKALAIEYSQHCKNLLLLGRDKERLENVKNLCSKTCNILTEILDVTNAKEIDKITNNFDQDFPIDLMIANAGISAGTGSKGEDINQLKEIYNTNIYGVINSIYPAINKMTTRRKGQIAIMSSMSAFMPIPTAPAYSSSKQCISFLGLALRQNLAKNNIKLSVIYPGFIKTPMTDTNKFSMPFIMSAEKAAQKIIKNISKNKSRIIFPKSFYFITLIVNILPFSIKQYLFNKTPAKDNL
jgi:short-subunit dehydrogenase